MHILNLDVNMGMSFVIRTRLFASLIFRLRRGGKHKIAIQFKIVLIICSLSFLSHSAWRILKTAKYASYFKKVPCQYSIYCYFSRTLLNLNISASFISGSSVAVLFSVITLQCFKTTSLNILDCFLFSYNHQYCYCEILWKIPSFYDLCIAFQLHASM